MLKISVAQREHSVLLYVIIIIITIIIYYLHLTVFWWSNEFIYGYFEQKELTNKVEVKGTLVLKNIHAFWKPLIPTQGREYYFYLGAVSVSLEK